MEWVGIKLNKRRKKRKKIPKTTIKIFCKGCKLLYISVQGGERQTQTHAHTRQGSKCEISEARHKKKSKE